MIAAISLLQNGPVPRYFSEEQLDLIRMALAHPSVMEFRRGLDRLGLYQFSQPLNQFISIFRHHQVRLTVKNQKGKQQFEKIVYNKFIKYVREAAAGRRIATLEDILVFVTCTGEIQILRLAKQPFISFHEVSIPEIERKEKAQDDQVSV